MTEATRDRRDRAVRDVRARRLGRVVRPRHALALCSRPVEARAGASRWSRSTSTQTGLAAVLIAHPGGEGVRDGRVVAEFAGARSRVCRYVPRQPRPTSGRHADRGVRATGSCGRRRCPRRRRHRGRLQPSSARSPLRPNSGVAARGGGAVRAPRPDDPLVGTSPQVRDRALLALPRTLGGRQRPTARVMRTQAAVIEVRTLGGATVRP